jgi:hypothetical protein
MEPFVGGDKILCDAVVLIKQLDMVLRYQERFSGSDKCAAVSTWVIGKLPYPSAFTVGDRLEIGWNIRPSRTFRLHFFAFE